LGIPDYYSWLAKTYHKRINVFIMEITREIAERIINSKALIEESSVPYKGVEVSYVGYNDADGEPFLWEETDEPYAIVSFKAMNAHQLSTAVQEFVDEDYDSCVNHNLSMRMSIEKANEIHAGVTIGVLICHEVEIDVDGEAELALLPKAFSPAKAKDVKKVSLADLLAKKAPKAEREVKLNEAEPAVVKPKAKAVR
jgi:hypothetical protein